MNNWIIRHLTVDKRVISIELSWLAPYELYEPVFVCTLPARMTTVWVFCPCWLWQSMGMSAHILAASINIYKTFKHTSFLHSNGVYWQFMSSEHSRTPSIIFNLQQRKRSVTAACKQLWPKLIRSPNYLINWGLMTLMRYNLNPLVPFQLEDGNFLWKWSNCNQIPKPWVCPADFPYWGVWAFELRMQQKLILVFCVDHHVALWVANCKSCSEMVVLVIDLGYGTSTT